MKPSITSTKISDGQKQTGIQLVVDAVRKAMGVAIDELSENGVVNAENFQRLMGKGNEVVASVTTLVKEKFAEMAENIAGCVKLISGAETLELEATDGKKTIAKSKDLFPGFLDGDFRNWGLDVKSEPTNKQKVQVHEMVKDGTFEQIFNGLGDNLDQLCLTQPQIIQFVEKHRKWLRTEGYGTFFLFKVNGEFFVAYVSVDDGELEVSVARLSYDGVWGAELRRRIVVPQLAPAN